MTTPPPSVSALSALEWISLTPTQLIAQSVDPAHRLHYTGHMVHLPTTWLPSIGNWAILNTRDFINSEARHLGKIPVKPSAYRQFRFRHDLMTGTDFEGIYGTGRWLHAEISWLAHRAELEEVQERNGAVTYSIGAACQAAHARRRKHPKLSMRLGMLPIELTLWTRVFDLFLSTVLSYDEWEELDDEDKECLWNEGHEGAAWDVDLVATAPAILELGQREFAATG